MNYILFIITSQYELINKNISFENKSDIQSIILNIIENKDESSNRKININIVESLLFIFNDINNNILNKETIIKILTLNDILKLVKYMNNP